MTTVSFDGESPLVKVMSPLVQAESSLESVPQGLPFLLNVICFLTHYQSVAGRYLVNEWLHVWQFELNNELWFDIHRCLADLLKNNTKFCCCFFFRFFTACFSQSIHCPYFSCRQNGENRMKWLSHVYE